MKYMSQWDGFALEPSRNHSLRGNMGEYLETGEYINFDEALSSYETTGDVFGLDKTAFVKLAGAAGAAYQMHSTKGMEIGFLALAGLVGYMFPILANVGLYVAQNKGYFKGK